MQAREDGERSQIQNCFRRHSRCCRHCRSREGKMDAEEDSHLLRLEGLCPLGLRSESVK